MDHSGAEVPVNLETDADFPTVNLALAGATGCDFPQPCIKQYTYAAKVKFK